MNTGTWLDDVEADDPSNADQVKAALLEAGFDEPRAAKGARLWAAGGCVDFTDLAEALTSPWTTQVSESRIARAAQKLEERATRPSGSHVWRGGVS